MSPDLTGMPKRVVVGPRTYKVRRSMRAWAKAAEKHEDARLRGLTDHEALTIMLYPHMEPDLIGEVLVHEIGHCITNVTGLDADIDNCKVSEEQVVTRSAPLWFQVWRDNPELAAFIGGGCR